MAESSRTADCARCKAIVKTDFEEVDGLFEVDEGEEDKGKGGEEMDGREEELVTEGRWRSRLVEMEFGEPKTKPSIPINSLSFSFTL